LERNIVALILNLMRYLFHNNDILQDRFERNNGIALLSFLIQRLPKRFIDINLLRICQEFVSEANQINDKSLLNAIYEHLIFDFRIWNKAEYEIRIGHIQYISTIIKDDKKYFRKKYGIQFFLDTIKTYFGQSGQSGANSSSGNNSTNQANSSELLISHQHSINITATAVAFNKSNANENQNTNEEDMRNLRNSFFGLVKYYAQKEIKIGELNAIISFLANNSTPRQNLLFLNDMLDMLISLVDVPANNSSSDQLLLLMFEPNVADGLYALLAQPELDKQIQQKIIKLIRILLKTKKVYEKSKGRLRLDECGGYAGNLYFNNNYNNNQNY
jgi:hypothetical protein